MSDLPAGPDQDFPIVIAGTPASDRQRMIALITLVFLSLVVATAVPFANIRLARVDAFVPVIQSIMCGADLLTATFLFAQYSVQMQRAMLALASGYICSGLFAFLQTLSFPGAYSPAGLIGDELNSPGWLFVFWHSSFSLAVIFYALFKDTDGPAKQSAGSIGRSIGIAVACAAAVTTALTWVATKDTAYLPRLYTNQLQQTSFANDVNIFLALLNGAAMVLLFVRRRTILDQWLIVTLVAWLPNFVVAIVFTVVRFTLGWYLSRVFALIAGSLMLVVLLTETVRLYSRLANAILLLRRERSDRLMSVDAATSAMAHEIRQPLTGVVAKGSAALRWLSRLPPGPEIEKVRELINATVASGLRAEEVIKGIRELFRPMAINRKGLLQLDDVVREALSLVQQDLQAAGISVRSEFGANLPKIDADHTQIQQVLLNLLKNAIDAMRDISDHERHLLVLTGWDGKSSVAVYIRDNGPGVAAKDRDSIFEPFFTTKPSGTGLGLSICRTIVEGHGGSLRLAKSDTKGAIFELELPIGG